MSPTSPSPLLMPPPTPYHPYSHIVPSPHASDTTLTPASSSMPLTILTLLQPPQDVTQIPPHLLPLHPHYLQYLRSCSALKISLRRWHLISALTLPYTSAPPLVFSTSYHPYASV
ncbi:hypothetical protein O181_046448 [Austropuccinia psidii MF-1]|uniref:Uncharacterized protein n=1 Tax=Austropuccinia psidii MF-1 TaxID=1389203 RepID=A0A9Q3DSB5_9BASI|nr:hypothetical protein [Austropuccinia psidii MF-1]